MPNPIREKGDMKTQLQQANALPLAVPGNDLDAYIPRGEQRAPCSASTKSVS